MTKQDTYQSIYLTHAESKAIAIVFRVSNLNEDSLLGTGYMVRIIIVWQCTWYTALDYYLWLFLRAQDIATQTN